MLQRQKSAEQGPLDLKQLLFKIQESQFGDKFSIMADAFFVGFKLGHVGLSDAYIQVLLRFIQELNNQVEKGLVLPEDKINLFEENIQSKPELPSLQKSNQTIYQSRINPQSVILPQSCGICLDQMSLSKLLAMENCIHIFHKSCLSSYFKSKQLEYPIKCPDFECNKEVAPNDLRELLTKEELELIDKASFTKFVQNNQNILFQCPTPDCTFIGVVEQQFFKCPHCKLDYCKLCRQKSHPGSCGETEFQILVFHEHYKQCSKCKAWIVKNKGCDHITCRCGNEFCYKCGGQYPACNCSQGCRRLIFRNIGNRNQ